MSENKDAFEGWAVVELMGHRKLAGYIREQSIAGAALLRLDVPGKDGKSTTQFYSPAALYCVTPTTEELARALAERLQPEPVHRFELPALPASSEGEVVNAEFDEGSDDPDEQGF